MSGGSGDTKTKYTASPEQRQIYRTLLPMIQGMSSLGTWQIGQPNMGAPQAPTMPSMTGVLSGVAPYRIPSVKKIQPTQKWFDSLSPEVKAGAWAPYEEGKLNLMETLGGSGMGDSARGGYSGAQGAALGQYLADASNNYGMSLWNMSAPGALAGWNAQLAQNQGNYRNWLTEAQQNYSNEMARLGSNYDTSRQAWGIPYGLTGTLPSTFSQGITTQKDGTNWEGMLSGGLLGGLAGFGVGGPVGAGVGGLGGMLGGK